MRYLIAYDISCPRRLQRIYRQMCNHALPLQDSVFLLIGEAQTLSQCLAAILPLLDNKQDDLRVYGLAPQGFWQSFGQAALPEGIDCGL